MNKAQFNKHVREVLRTYHPYDPQYSTENTARYIINIFIESIITALKKEDEVRLTGFGRFYKASIAARDGRNPKTGQLVKVPAYIQPKFTAGKNLKDFCNGKEAINNIKDER